MKIAALCGFGMGSSMLVKMNMDDLFKELGLKAEIFPWDLGSYKGAPPVDLIVATAEMKPHLADAKCPVILLNNIVNKTELREKLVAHLRERGELSDNNP